MFKKLALPLIFLTAAAAAVGGWYWLGRGGAGPLPPAPAALSREASFAVRNLATLCAAGPSAEASPMRAARSRLVEMGAEAVPAIEDCLATDDKALGARYGLEETDRSDLQMHLVEVLTQIDPKRAVPTLERLVVRTSADVRVAAVAVDQLEKQGPPERLWTRVLDLARPLRSTPSPDDPRAVLLDRLDLFRDPKVADWAQAGIARETDPVLRGKLVQVLGRKKDPARGGFLAGLLTDLREDPNLREEAALALRNLNRPEDLGLFLDLASVEKHRDDTPGRRAAAHALAWSLYIPDARVGERGRDILARDPDPFNRIFAVSIIALEKSPAAAAALLAALDTETGPQVLQAIARVLGGLKIPALPGQVAERLKSAPADDPRCGRYWAVLKLQWGGREHRADLTALAQALAPSHPKLSREIGDYAASFAPRQDPKPPPAKER